MDGKRHDLEEDEYNLAPGEYGKNPGGVWYCRPPGTGLLGGLAKHTVIEHEDGTITVSPSILCRGGAKDEQWHGYLERGVWREDD